MDKKIPISQMTAWLLAAVIGPVFCVVGQDGWTAVLPVCVVCGVVSACALRYGSNEMPRWLCALEWLWLAIFLGVTAQQSATCWEDAGDGSAVGIMLLILAALAAQQGANRGARVGATLTWLILPVLGIVLLAGTTEINLEWIRRESEMPKSSLPLLLLLPCLAVFLPLERKRVKRWLIPVLVLVTFGASVLLDAIMGESIIKNAPNSFYEYSKGITLFDVAERFEALVACVLTAGWVSLFTILLSAAYHLTEKIFDGAGKSGVWLCAVAGGALMCILHIDTQWTVVGTLIFWGFLPVLTQGIENVKKSKKSKNSP